MPDKSGRLVLDYSRNYRLMCGFFDSLLSEFTGKARTIDANLATASVRDMVGRRRAGPCSWVSWGHAAIALSRSEPDRRRGRRIKA